MEKWHALAPNWALFSMLALFAALNLMCSYYGFFVETKTLSLVLIPILSILYFRKKQRMANIFVAIFMLYFFGMIFNVIDNFSLSTKIPEAFFTGAYILLIFVLMGKLRNMKFDVLVSWYLGIAFLINTYLLFQLFIALKDSFQDQVIFTLTISKGIALLVMASLAFAIYLSKESKQAIIFLMVVCCFIFSDVLSFINTSYLYFWLFEAVQKIFQGLGVTLAFAYVYSHQEMAIKNDRRKVFRPISQPDPMSVQS